MRTDRPLLFASDGSACAERARPYAERLAAALGAALCTLRVDTSDDAPYGFDMPTFSAADVAADLDVPEGPEAAVAAPPMTSVCFDPDPARAICLHAGRIGARLVVMGTHGRHGFDRFLLGSTAETVLRRAPCPVLVVPCAPEATAAALDGGCILVPDDLTDAAARALHEGARLARALGGSLDVVHVVDQVRLATPYGLYPPNAYTIEQSRPRIEAALKVRAADAGVPVEVHACVGKPADEIAAEARTRGAALVVMGSHGHRGLDRVLLGSTAEALVRRAPCPVLVVRPCTPTPSTLDAATADA